MAALEQAKAEVEQLDPEELKAVSGGKYTEASKYYVACELLWDRDYVDEYDHNDWCVATWHCYTAMLHTGSKDEDISCWSDYMCAIINK